jgi:hypothetical protein
MPRIWAYFFILIFHLRAAALFSCDKNRGFLSSIKNCHPILPNLSLQDKQNYTILLPNPHFFFHFSQTQHRWFSSYLTHASSSSPGFFLFFFSSSPSSLTHTSSPGFFSLFFFLLLLLPHPSRTLLPLVFFFSFFLLLPHPSHTLLPLVFFLFFFSSSSSPSPLTHVFFFSFFLLLPLLFPWFFSSSPPSPLRRRHSLATTNPAVTHHFQPNHLWQILHFRPNPTGKH